MESKYCNRNRPSIDCGRDSLGSRPSLNHIQSVPELEIKVVEKSTFSNLAEMKASVDRLYTAQNSAVSSKAPSRKRMSKKNS